MMRAISSFFSPYSLRLANRKFPAHSTASPKPFTVKVSITRRCLPGIWSSNHLGRDVQARTGARGQLSPEPSRCRSRPRRPSRRHQPEIELRRNAALWMKGGVWTLEPRRHPNLPDRGSRAPPFPLHSSNLSGCPVGETANSTAVPAVEINDGVLKCNTASESLRGCAKPLELGAVTLHGT